MLDRQGLKLQLKSLDKARVVRGEETAALESILEQFLASVQAEGRDVDDWEANCLHSVIDALAKHRPGVARANLLHALEVTRHHATARRHGVTLQSLAESLVKLRAAMAHHAHSHARPVAAVAPSHPAV